nr:protein FAM200A-like [Parasteatoda tepidariorum]
MAFKRKLSRFFELLDSVTEFLATTDLVLSESLKQRKLETAYLTHSLEKMKEINTEILDLKYDCEAKVVFKKYAYKLAWVKLMDTYPQLWKQTEPLLISFPSTYLAETGFSSVFQLLTMQRARLDICFKGDPRLNLRSIKPDIQALT